MATAQSQVRQLPGHLIFTLRGVPPPQCASGIPLPLRPGTQTLTLAAMSLWGLETYCHNRLMRQSNEKRLSVSSLAARWVFFFLAADEVKLWPIWT